MYNDTVNEQEIICPYCYARFKPWKMTFRLKAPRNTDIVNMLEEYVLDDDYRENECADIQLRDYYKSVYRLNNRDAGRLAEEKSPYGCIDIDTSLKDIEEYDASFMKEHGFIRSGRYQDQFLEERVCPYCHNDLVEDAGIYEMHLFTLIGTAGSGKTVYTRILSGLFEGVYFNEGYEAEMMPLGTEEEILQQRKEQADLLRDHKFPSATFPEMDRARYICQYSYKTADHMDEKKKIILIFQEVPADILLSSNSTMRKAVQCIKSSSGLFLMVDIMQLNGLNPAGEKNYKLVDMLNALRKVVSTIGGNNKLAIPTAIVLTKCDCIREILFSEYEKTPLVNILNKPSAYNVRNYYVSKDSVEKMESTIKQFFNYLRETRITAFAESCLSQYAFFAVSASMEDKRNKERPLHITDPFFWLLAKNNLMPFMFTEVYEDNKCRQMTIDTPYYDFERSSVARRRHYESLQAKGILRKSIFGPKWHLISRPHDF